ncbi:hypothetical protein PDTK01_36840 [Phycicoccus sp. DTK01]|nr:hypothetical protein PDTK01_36840 [Phycicoccus sp. DTK01]
MEGNVGSWADPLTTVSLLAAAWLYIWRAAILPAMHAGPRYERLRIQGLLRALTLSRAKEILGCEPAHVAQMESEDSGHSGMQVYHFNLRRTHVRVFVKSDSTVYGFTVLLRRPSLMGAVDLGGVKARLGLTPIASAWCRDVEPSFANSPYTRSHSYAESSFGWGYTTYRTWAAGCVHYGSCGPGPLLYTFWNWRKPKNDGHTTLVRLAGSLGSPWRPLDLRSLHPEVEDDRRSVAVNLLAVALQGKLLSQMVEMHDQHMSLLDGEPPIGRMAWNKVRAWRQRRRH